MINGVTITAERYTELILAEHENKLLKKAILRKVQNGESYVCLSADELVLLIGGIEYAKSV